MPYDDGMETTAATKVLELSGLDGLRLLSAFQVLSMPSGCMGVTHKRAREVIVELTGKKPVRGSMPPAGTSLAGYLSWHLGMSVVEGVAT
mgnify:CR=1 FL=1